jgi:hypothetical protein
MNREARESNICLLLAEGTSHESFMEEVSILMFCVFLIDYMCVCVCFTICVFLIYVSMFIVCS